MYAIRSYYAGCSTMLVAWLMTPGTSTLPAGSLTSRHTTHSCSWRGLAASNVITSYSIHYTMLYEHWPGCRSQCCDCYCRSRWLGSPRITSYNVCYTKLLRLAPGSAAHAAPPKAPSPSSAYTCARGRSCAPAKLSRQQTAIKTLLDIICSP